jgi:hypothetical protein
MVSMNTTLQEHIKQAIFAVEQEGIILPIVLEKFAQLIAEECANICDNFQARDVGMQPSECAGAIRHRFGVEG